MGKKSTGAARRSWHWALSRRAGVIATASCGEPAVSAGRWNGTSHASCVVGSASTSRPESSSTRGTGGDLDLVAAAEGKLIYVELKLADHVVHPVCDTAQSVLADLPWAGGSWENRS